MKIKVLLREMRFEMFKNILLLNFLKGVIVFYIVDIIKSFFDITLIVSFAAAGAYFIYLMVRDLRKISIKQFEKHNPEVREMLSTAADNMDRDNVLVQELFNEVVHKMKKVSSGTLVKPSSLLIMILVIPVLAIADFELNPLRVEALSQDRIIEEFERISFVQNILGNRQYVDGEIIEQENLEDADIYGEKSIAILGNDEINLELAFGSHTDLRRPGEEEKEALVFTDYPGSEGGEVLADTSVLRENIKESDLARQYNEVIRSME